MTAVTVGSTTDFTSDSPDNYEGVNNQEPSSLTLSGSDLWLVDPAQLEGETSDSLYPEFSVTNLSETTSEEVIVPFENIDSDEPEVSFSTLSAISDDTYESELALDDNTVEVAATTGNVELTSSTSSASISETESQLSGTSVETSFGESSTGSSDSGGESLSQISLGEGESSSGTEGSTDGNTISISSSTNGTEGGGDSGAEQTSVTQQTDPSGDPAAVPFGFTESLGLVTLLLIVGSHRLFQRKATKIKAAC